MELLNQNTEAVNVRGPFDVHNAGEIYSALLDAVRRPSGLVLNLAEVDSCDAAALQLLFAAQKTAAGLGCTFRLSAVSDTVVETAAALGLSLDELSNGGTLPRGQS